MTSKRLKTLNTLCLHICSIVLVLALSSCAKQKKKDEMSIEELSQKTYACIEKKKNNDAIGYLEEIMARFPDHENIGKYKMLLAEMYFKDGRHASAQEFYEHYTQFYPADQQVEYAKYKSILSMFYQTLKTDCDQSETEVALKLCQNYLDNAAFKKYRKDVIDIQNTCENRLIDKEIYVFNFYLNQEKYDAARNRIKFLKDKYLASNAGLEARLLYLECKLAQKEKKPNQINDAIKTLKIKYPESQFTQMAQGLTRKTAFVF